jgi:hypothetical protein
MRNPQIQIRPSRVVGWASGKHPEPIKIKIVLPQIKTQNMHKHNQELRKWRTIFEFSTWNVRTLYRSGMVTTIILQPQK